MAHAYATENACDGLAATAFTFSSGTPDNRDYLGDGRVDRRVSAGSATSSLTLAIDLGTSRSLNCIALLNTNLRQATSPTVKVEGAFDAGFTNQLVTAKAATSLRTKDSPRDYVLQFTAVSRRYWRLTFTWTGSFTFELGELFAGTLTALSRASVYGGYGKSRRWFGQQVESEGGLLSSFTQGGPGEGRRLVWEDLTGDELSELVTMLDAVQGFNGDVLWVDTYGLSASADASPYAEQECCFGRFAERELNAVEVDLDIWNGARLTLRGQGRGVGA